jgi:hypothetical protein
MGVSLGLNWFRRMLIEVALVFSVMDITKNCTKPIKAKQKLAQVVMFASRPARSFAPMAKAA